MLNINPQTPNHSYSPSFKSGRTCFFSVEQARITAKKLVQFKEDKYLYQIYNYHKLLEEAILGGANDDVTGKLIQKINELALKQKSKNIKHSWAENILKSASDYFGQLYGVESKQKIEIDNFNQKFLKNLYSVSTYSNKQQKVKRPNSNLYIMKTIRKQSSSNCKNVSIDRFSQKLNKHFDFLNIYFSILHNDFISNVVSKKL